MNFLAKILKWMKATPTERHYNKYKPFYEEVEVEDWKATQPLRIIKGEFAGIVFLFDALRIKPDGTVAFSCVILDGSPTITQSKKFQELARNILLCTYFDASVDSGEEHEDRTNYSEKPFEQRCFHSKDSSILKE